MLLITSEASERKQGGFHYMIMVEIFFVTQSVSLSTKLLRYVPVVAQQCFILHSRELFIRSEHFFEFPLWTHYGRDMSTFNFFAQNGHFWPKIQISKKCLKLIQNVIQDIKSRELDVISKLVFEILKMDKYNVLCKNFKF